MSTTTPTRLAEVPLPAGAESPRGWEPDFHSPPFRIVYGAEHPITDHEVRVRARAWQNSDGTLDEIVVVFGTADDELNSDRPASSPQH